MKQYAFPRVSALLSGYVFIEGTRVPLNLTERSAFAGVATEW
jgi:hypothetical protein